MSLLCNVIAIKIRPIFDMKCQLFPSHPLALPFLPCVCVCARARACVCVCVFVGVVGSEAIEGALLFIVCVAGGGEVRGAGEGRYVFLPADTIPGITCTVELNKFNFMWYVYIVQSV